MFGVKLNEEGLCVMIRWSTPRHRPLYPHEIDVVPIPQVAGWAPGTVWTGAENLAPPELDPLTVQTVASRYTD